MFLPSLHALGGDDPDLGVQVDLIPSGATHLTGAGSGQDQELQRLCSDAITLAQVDHEAGQGVDR